MQVTIPDRCECGDDYVCARCCWETACAIVEANAAFERIIKQQDQ